MYFHSLVTFLTSSCQDEFGKSGQDQTQSGFPKFVTENGWLMLDFPGRIWEIWTGSDTIRISQIRDGKWLAEHGGQV